ncbi:MAG: hypothetical protein J0L69_03490 [Bacteroidetes bacterium]|nr:hypothetical protein [Bacteroidota bacterium]
MTRKIIFFTLLVIYVSNIKAQAKATFPKSFFTENFDSVVVYGLYESHVGITSNGKFNNKAVKTRVLLSATDLDSLNSILSSKKVFNFTNSTSSSTYSYGILFYKNGFISSVIDFSIKYKFLVILYKAVEESNKKWKTLSFQARYCYEVNNNGVTQFKKFLAQIGV